jgi:hypothetical protein
MFTFFLIALVLSVLSVSLAILVVFTNMLKLDRLPRLLMAFSVFGNVCAMYASINSILDLPITSYIMVEAFFFCVLVICIYTVIREIVQQFPILIKLAVLKSNGLLVILLTSIGTVMTHMFLFFVSLASVCRDNVYILKVIAKSVVMWSIIMACTIGMMT